MTKLPHIEANFSSHILHYDKYRVTCSSQPPVDIKTKVALQFMLLILKRNLCFCQWVVWIDLMGHPVLWSN